MAALTIGGFGPTKKTNKIIKKMEIKTENFLFKKLVKPAIIEASSVIFIPDKTTM
jgi:hypothetical protein